MGGCKIKKHTAKELNMKDMASKMKNGGCGGGDKGKEGRKAPKEGKKDVFLKCTICLGLQPSLKSMEIHHESKHANKVAWNPKLYETEETTEKTDEKTDEKNYEAAIKYYQMIPASSEDSFAGLLGQARSYRSSRRSKELY